MRLPTHSDIDSFVKSERFVHVLVAIGALIIAVFLFEAGVAVGFHRAEFAEHWEENYDRNFGAPGNMLGMPGRDIPSTHGASGRIVSVDLPTFVIAGSDENEKVVLIASSTIIRDGANTVAADDLMVGDFATVIGNPDDNGEVGASFIRVMPPPPGTSSTSPAP